MRSKLLIVDDTEGVLNEMARILGRTGMEIITAGSGMEAMKLLIREKPLVAFLDLMLPEMNGDIICKFVKERPDLQHTSVIIVTAAGEQYLQRCFQCGCDAYVLKPILEDDILEKVKTILDEKGIPATW